MRLFPQKSWKFAASVAAVDSRSVPLMRSWPWVEVCWCRSIHYSLRRPWFCPGSSSKKLGKIYTSARCSSGICEGFTINKQVGVFTGHFIDTTESQDRNSWEYQSLDNCRKLVLMVQTRHISSTVVFYLLQYVRCQVMEFHLIPSRDFSTASGNLSSRMSSSLNSCGNVRFNY